MSYVFKYPRPMVTVDAVIFGIDERDMKVLLVRRLKDPFRDMWALPGGFVDQNETLEQAVARELQEETGLTGLKLFPGRPYSEPERDPRGRNIAYSFIGLVMIADGDLQAGDDAGQVLWRPVTDLPELAFDHARICSDGLVRLRELVLTSDVLFSRLPQLCRKDLLFEALAIVFGGPLKEEMVLTHFEMMGFIEPAGAELDGTPLFRITG
ncbi:MAG: NUDIX hydrolase [Candidatus Brocadiia bacterium]